MSLQADWGYILEVAERRLKYNKTHRHIVSEKGRLEIIGPAGEVAARRFLGLLAKSKPNGWQLFRSLLQCLLFIIP